MAVSKPGQPRLWPVAPTGSRMRRPEEGPARESRPLFMDPGYPDRQWISLYFKSLPFEVIFNSNKGTDAIAHAVLDNDRAPARILLCDSAAAGLGVHPGQPVNAALALAPELGIATRDCAAETAALHALAADAMQFTPAVHIDPAPALLLEVRGSLRLFGGLERLRERLTGHFGQCGHAFAMVCAPTAFAALWLARAGCDWQPCARADLPGRLASLPIGCLGWPARIESLLNGIGVATLGDCIRLPREGLARRIGPGRLDELDQGFGARPELRTFHEPPQRFERRLDMPAETADAALLLAGLEQLLDELGQCLRRRQGAVRVLWVSLHRRDGGTTLERLALLRALTDVSYLHELARIRFESVKFRDMVVALTVRANIEPGAPQGGPDLFGERADDDGDVLALIEQLRARLGTAAVHGVCPVEAHRPEAAWRAVDTFADVATRATDLPASVHAPVCRRPVWILDTPQALRTQAGRPVFGQRLELDGAPERIETGWWDGSDVRRDYYVARNAAGMRLWIFRDCRDAGWYLHGLFG